MRSLRRAPRSASIQETRKPINFSDSACIRAANIRRLSTSNLGLILHEQGKLAQAVTEYREAKRLAPSEASVRNNLGNTYCDQGNFDSAIEELHSLYREHPEWQQGHACLASAYMAKKNYDDAVEELQLAVRQNPTGSTEHRILGQALLLANKPRRTITTRSRLA